MIIESSQFPRLISALSNAPSNTTIPVLHCARITFSDGTVAATTTDLEQEITAVIPAQGKHTHDFCVNAAKLRSILSSCAPNQPLHLVPATTRVTVKAGNARWTLSTLDPQDFPVFPQNEAEHRLTLSGADFRAGLQAVMPAMANKDVRYYLNGLYIEARDDKLSFIGTDGHRLHAWSMPLEGTQSYDAILPRDTVRSLAKFAGSEINILISKRAATFAEDGKTLNTKLIDGRYPDYRRILPNPPHTLTVSAEELKSAVSRCAMVMADSKYQGVLVKISGTELVINASYNGEEAVDSVAIATSGPEYQAGLDSRYLIEALNLCGDKDAVIRYGKEEEAIIVTTEQANPFAVVMPMNL